MARRRGGMWLVVLGLLAGGTAQSADLFSVTASSGTLTGRAAFDSVNGLFDGLAESRLAAILPGYVGGDVVSMGIDFRGLSMQAEFPDLSGPRLKLRIPFLGIDQDFIGATREQSRSQLRAYFRNGDALGRIMRALAELSPVDPIAGNPTSLQARMVSGDFERRFGRVVARVTQRQQAWRPAAGEAPILLAAAGDASPGVDPAPALGPWRAGIELSHYRGGGLSSTAAALPFSLALGGGADPALSIEGELQVSRTDGATTLGGHAGLSYRMKLSDSWYLMPAASFGAVGSRELGSVGSLYAASIVSALRLYQSADATLWMGNGLHVTRSGRLAVQGYSFDPKLQNTALSNGLILTLNPGAFTQGGWLELSLADTRYTGSDLYDRRYDELGASLVRRSVLGGRPVLLRTGLRYLSTTHTQGWGAQLQLSF